MAAPKSWRHKKNPKIVSPSGWGWFFLGLLVALFFGGAVRTLLSEQQVHARLKIWLEKEMPDLEVNFARAELKLAKSVWPWLGLSVEDISLKPRALCRGIHSAHLKTLDVPISLRDLLFAEVRVGHLEADGLEVNLEVCPKPNAAAASEKVPEKVSGEVLDKMPGKMPGKMSDKVVGGGMDLDDGSTHRESKSNPFGMLASRLAGFRIRQAKVIRLDQPMALREFEIPSMAFELKRDASFELKAEVIPGQAWKDALGRDPLKIDLEGQWPKAQFRLKVPVREGQMVGEGELSLPDGQISGSLKCAFVPGSQVVETLTHWGVVTDKLQVKRIWFNGDLTVKGSLRELKTLRIHVKRLNLTGDAGEVISENLEFSPFDRSADFSPIRIHLESFSVKQLLEMVGRRGYTGVIGEFGEVSGDLNVVGPENIDFTGQLQNLSLLFSRRSVRTKQKVKSIAARFALKDNRVSGLVDKIDLDEGRFRGFVSFNMDHRWLSGVFQVKVDDLDFQPAVKKVMLGGELSPLALYGQGRIENGQVVYFSGELGLDRFSGPNWRAQGIKVRSEFADEKASLSLRAQEVGLQSGHEWLGPLQKVMGPAASNETELTLRHLSSQFDLNKSEGEWRNALATVSGNRVVMASSGKWKVDQADGWLEVDQARGKNQRYLVKGTIPSLQLTPAANTAKESAKARGKKRSVNTK